MDKCSVNDAIKDGFPIIIGFVPIAITLGILSKTAGLTAVESITFSMFVFAGASQFIALNLLIAGAGIGEIIVTTFLVNLRHLLFASSLAPKLTINMKRAIPFIAFGLTDEIFSITSLKQKKLTKEYVLLLEFGAYASLALGTLVGNLLGEILPTVIQLSLGIALYALFSAIIVPEIKKSMRVLILLLLAGILNCFFLLVLKLPQGWSVIITIFLVAFGGIFINEKDVCNE